MDARALGLDPAYIAAIQKPLKVAFLQHQRNLGSEELTVWAFSMSQHRVTPTEFQNAILYWLANKKFFPQPIEIAELVKGETDGNRALRAIEELRNEIGGVGPYRTPSLADPVLLQTIEDFGGWFRINELFEDTEAFRTRFLIAYRTNQKATPVMGLSNRIGLQVRQDDEQPQLGFEENTMGRMA